MNKTKNSKCVSKNCPSCGAPLVMSNNGEWWLCHSCRKKYRKDKDAINQEQRVPTPYYQSVGPYQPMLYLPAGPQPGGGLASGSLVCGILSILFIFFGWTVTGMIGIIFGIIGIALASQAKKKGNFSGARTGGLATSIIGLIICSIKFIVFLACVSAGAAIFRSFMR